MTRDKGSASVVAVALLGVVVVIGLALAAIVGAAADRTAARSAADLAALAGAYEARRELAGAEGEPCAAARRTARANSATVTLCEAYRDGSVQVTVAQGRATAQARAGPEMGGPGGDSG